MGNRWPGTDGGVTMGRSLDSGRGLGACLATLVLPALSTAVLVSAYEHDVARGHGPAWPVATLFAVLGGGLAIAVAGLVAGAVACRQQRVVCGVSGLLLGSLLAWLYLLAAGFVAFILLLEPS